MNKENPLKYRQYMLDINDFQLIKQINYGGYGSVYSVQKKDTDEIYAAKVIFTLKDKYEYKKMISREISIISQCQHPTIVRFYGYSLKDFNNESNITIFMEFLKKGSLAKLLDSIREGTSDIIFNNTSKQIILIGIARGMMLLHQQGIIHRDLKPENVLIDDELYPHISDFGLSKFINNFEQSQSQQCGSCKYMAPEIISGTHYGFKIDVYSFAILMFEVVTNTDSYPEVTRKKIHPLALLNYVSKEDYRPTFNVPVKNSIKKLIESCWSKNPKERPTFEEIYKKLAFGIECSIEGIYDEQLKKDEKVEKEEEEEEFKDDESVDNDSHPYYLDDVNVDDVLSYIDDLDYFEYNKDFMKMKEMIEKEIKPFKVENQRLKKKIDQLEQKVKDQEQQINILLNNSIQNSEKPPTELKFEPEPEQTTKDHFIINHSQIVPPSQQSPLPPPPPPPPAAKSKSKSKSLIPFQSYNYDNNPDHLLEGIIYNLTIECGGNVVDNGIIDVTASSFQQGYFPKFAVDLNSNNMFYSELENNQWLKYDFKEKKIQPTYYTIKTRSDGYGFNNLSSWVIEGSNDDNGWITIDTRYEKIKSNTIKIFKINLSLVENNSFRFIRLRQIEFKKSGKLVLEALEYFGNLY